MLRDLDLDGSSFAFFAQQLDLLVNKTHQVLHLVQDGFKLNLQRAGLLPAFAGFCWQTQTNELRGDRRVLISDIFLSFS